MLRCSTLILVYALQFNMSSLTDKLTEMEDDNEPPQIKLGDASVAAPFTSKLANVQASMYETNHGICIC